MENIYLEASKSSHIKYGQFACYVCNSPCSLLHNTHQHKPSETWEASHEPQDNLFFSDTQLEKKQTDQFASTYAEGALPGFFHHLH